MIPSRKRIAGLLHCVDSVLKTSVGSDYNVLIRLDDDDAESIYAAQTLFKGHPVVTVIVGPRLGYSNLDTGYYTELARIGGATWCWIMNDDMEVIAEDGRNWYDELKKVPTQKHYVQPETHRLGGSTYSRDNRTGSPIFLNGCWKECGWGTIPEKADYILTQALDMRNWWCSFLEGITVWHHRGTNEEYVKEHQT